MAQKKHMGESGAHYIRPEWLLILVQQTKTKPLYVQASCSCFRCNSMPVVMAISLAIFSFVSESGPVRP